MEDRYVYILNLTRYRFFLLGMALIATLSTTFIIGLCIGIKSNDYRNQSYPTSINESTVNPGSEAIFTETSHSLRGESPSVISRDGQLSSKSFSSADLLLQDTKDGEIYKLTSPSSRIKETPTASPPVPNIKRETTRIASSGHVTKYFIQLVVSSDKKKAERIVKNLLIRKYKGYLRSSKRKTKIYYSVRVGLYEDKKKAVRDLKILKEKGGFKDAFIKINIPRKA